MARDLTPDNTDAIRKAVIILGDSGVGKTSLASTSESPYFLDVEGRAEHVHVHRFVPEQDGAGWDELVQRIKDLKASPKLEGGFGINFKGIPIKTVVLDTIDRAQELLRMKNSSMTVNQKDKQRFYGILLDRMLQDLLWPLLSLPVNIILVSHTQEKSLDAIEQKASNDSAPIAPETGLALEGQVRGRVRNYFDNAFHMIRRQDGSTIVLTTAQIYEGRFLYAKDKKWLFGGKSIPVKWIDGRIESDAMKKVFDEMHLAKPKNLVAEEVKKALRDYAILNRIMADEKDKTGAKLITDHVMPKIKEKLESVTKDTYDSVLSEGMKFIDELVIELQK